MPDDVVDIRFLLRDPEKFASVMTKAARATDEAGKKTDDLGNKAAAAIGIYTRLDKAVAMLGAGIRNGAGGAQLLDLVKNARDAQNRVLKYETPAKAPSFSSNRALAAGIVSGGKGGGIGAGIDAISAGISGMGPEGAAAAAILEAAKALGEALFGVAKAAQEASIDLDKLRASTGASSTQAGQLKLFGAAGGFDAGGLAASIRDKALSDPIAYGQALRSGVTYAPNGIQQNNGGQLLQLIDALRRMPEQERLYTERSLGAEALDPLAHASEGQVKLLQDTGDLGGKIQTPEQVQRAADFQASIATAQAAFQNLVTSLSGPAIDALTDIINDIVKGVNQVAEWAADHQGILMQMAAAIETLYGLATGNLDLVAKGIERGMAGASQELSDYGKDFQKLGGDNSGDPLAAALDDHGTKIERNTLALHRLNENFSSGAGYDSALPPGVRYGPALNAALQSGALRQGALG